MCLTTTPTHRNICVTHILAHILMCLTHTPEHRHICITHVHQRTDTHTPKMQELIKKIESLV